MIHSVRTKPRWKTTHAMRTPTLVLTLWLAALTAFAAETETVTNHPAANSVEKSSPQENRSGLPWKSGVSPGTSKGSEAIDKTSGFGKWRGRSVDIAAVFIGKNSWQKSYESYLTK